MSAYHLRTFYVARQAAWGVPESQATFVLQGVTDGKVTVKIEDEILNTIGRNIGNIIIRKERESEITISLTATYEQILYIMHALFGAVTPAGTTAPYVWTYTLPSNNSINPQLYTIFYGIENNNYRLHSCFLTEITVSGEANNTLNVDLTFISPFAPESYTVTIPSFSEVNAISVREADVYLTNINTHPFNVGSFELTLTSFEINVNTNRHIKQFVGVEKLFGEGKWQIDGSLNFEYNQQTRDIINNTFTNVTLRNFGLRFQSFYPNKRFYISMPILITDTYDLFSDLNGNATVNVNFTALHNSTIGSAMRVEVFSETDTLL